MTDLLTRFQPLGFSAIIIVIIIAFFKSILKGDFKNLVLQIALCGIVAYLVYDPKTILLLGKFIVETLLELGGDVIGSTEIKKF